jgi:hypothetical protein
VAQIAKFADYTEKCILAIADALKTLSVELYKLRRDIENRRGDHDSTIFRSSPMASTKIAPRRTAMSRHARQAMAAFAKSWRRE